MSGTKMVLRNCKKKKHKRKIDRKDHKIKEKMASIGRKKIP